MGQTKRLNRAVKFRYKYVSALKLNTLSRDVEQNYGNLKVSLKHSLLSNLEVGIEQTNPFKKNSSNANFFPPLEQKLEQRGKESSALQMDEGWQVWDRAKEGAWQCYKSYSNKTKEPWAKFILPLSLQKNSTPCEKWYTDRWKNIPSPLLFPGIYPTHLDNTCTRFPPPCRTELLCYWFNQVASTEQVTSPALARCASVTAPKLKET